MRTGAFSLTSHRRAGWRPDSQLEQVALRTAEAGLDPMCGASIIFTNSDRAKRGNGNEHASNKESRATGSEGCKSRQLGGHGRLLSNYASALVSTCRLPESAVGKALVRHARFICEV